MIRWGEPLWLLALALPAALLVLDLIVNRFATRARERFASLPLWTRLAPTRSPKLRRAKSILFILALVFLVIGLANPRVGTRYEDVTREGIDIFLLVDVSKSMDTQDIRPSRIDKTRYELLQFLKDLKGDRVGLIPFSGTAYTVCPLTLDYAAVSMFIDLLSTELIPNPGTNLASAIHTAMKSFTSSEDESERSKAILIISDGEDHEGGAVDAAKEAYKSGIRVFTIGMALGKGDPIPLFDANGNPSGWKTDDEGHVVTSRLNEDILRDVASAGGGDYRRAGQGGEAFKAIYRKIFNLERSELSQKRISGYEDRFQWFLMAALLLFLAEFILPLGAIKMRGLPMLKVLLPALLLIGLGSTNVYAQKAHKLVKEGNNNVADGEVEEALTNYLEARTTRDSLRPELLYDLGGAYARMGDIQRADSLLANLPPDADPSILSRAHYNRGTAFAGAQQYDKAVDAFINALQYDPQDMDSKVNLEMALRMMQQQQQQQDQQQQNDQNQDKEDQQDQQQQQNQDQQDQEQQDQQQQQDQQNQEQQDQQQQQQQQNPEEMPPEMAQRFLDKLQQDEKELLQELVRQQVPVEKQKTKKDW